MSFTKPSKSRKRRPPSLTTKEMGDVFRQATTGFERLASSSSTPRPSSLELVMLEPCEDAAEEDGAHQDE